MLSRYTHRILRGYGLVPQSNGSHGDSLRVGVYPHRHSRETKSYDTRNLSMPQVLPAMGGTPWAIHMSSLWICVGTVGKLQGEKPMKVTLVILALLLGTAGASYWYLEDLRADLQTTAASWRTQ